MELIQVENSGDSRAKEIYSSYCEAFPVDERRSEQQFNKLFSNSKAMVLSILNDENSFIGYLIGWELNTFFFLEHFEIFPQYRNSNYGTQVLSHLVSVHPKIILESEPSDLNEMACRRIGFYTRNGFKVIDENYLQPAYGIGKEPVQLWLLANFAPENTEILKAEILKTVYAEHQDL